MSTAVRALRGATTLETDDPEHMQARVSELVEAIRDRNQLDKDDIISVMVTATTDLQCMFPATAVRKSGLDDVPLLGAQEVDVPGGLERCVRLMLHVATPLSKSEMQHVYLHGAKALRRDLAEDDA